MSESVAILGTKEEFDTKTNTGVVLVDFFAPWCGPCRMQLPILEAVAAKVAGKAHVYKVNTDELTAVAAQFNVESIPTLILLKNGSVVQRFVGVQSESILLAAIEKA